ncbi:hypothetical protein MRB53_022022 [Persea americana]|uniref:Uncharacterized protein n=1 Tax=Persea americana TaxID=3435 RepID=A0ACC2L5L1_PERAE|nr:hypothetical protein MRB53_022022 [Persea americana]
MAVGSTSETSHLISMLIYWPIALTTSSTAIFALTSNHGLDPKTFNGSHNWYQTHPHMLELIIHRQMLEYPRLTADPSFADAVFLLYYSSVIFPLS